MNDREFACRIALLAFWAELTDPDPNLNVLRKDAEFLRATFGVDVLDWVKAEQGRQSVSKPTTLLQSLSRRSLGKNAPA